MIKETMQALSQAIRALIGDLGSLAIFTGLYALFLAALYGFISTREATVWQVLLTLLFVATAPVLFFLLQAAIINHARTGRIEWSHALGDSCKLALVALPVILAGVGIMWLLNRWQLHFPAPAFNPHAVDPTTHQVVAMRPLHWPTVSFATLRGLILGIALPLVLIHLWIAVAGKNLLASFRGGARAFLNRLGRILARAFAPQSVLIYSLGLIVFGVIPYALLFVRITANGAWNEIGIFTARLLLVFVFILLGWVITLSAFAKSSPELPHESPTPSADEADASRVSEMKPSVV